MIEIWVPMVGDGKSPQTAYRPDVPAGLNWTTDEGAPTDFSKAGNPPATSYFNVIVDEADLPKIINRVAEKNLPERDRVIVQMIRACRDGWDQKADAFFNSIPNMAIASDARKQMVKDILIQAVHRGLSAAKAEDIRKRLALPVLSEAEGPEATSGL